MSFNRVHLWAILGAALLIRLLTLGAYPLMDTTEARYGEMARLMIETGNWITPQFDYGVPFWGKPPLFTWMSAVGIETFGINEFAVRVPHWIAGVVILLFMGLFAKRLGYSGLITALVLATCGIFSIAAGAVMTDMALTLGMTIAMLGFYLCWLSYEEDKPNRGWGYIGFVGLAIGLLAKGPLVIVLMGLAVVPWLIVQHGFTQSLKVLWQRFPIATGTLLMLVIALPWYVLAERATPGFIDYFIVGEHFKRFLVSGWEGDLYGTAHNEVRGTIWLFWLYSAAPWSIVLPVLLWKKRRSLKSTIKPKHGIVSFLLFWMIAPLVLFTFSGNILPAYVLPGVPAIGLLMAILVSDLKQDKKWFKVTASIVPALLVITVGFIHFDVGDKRSDKVVLRMAQPDVATYYVGSRPFSGQFYSSGQAKLLSDDSELNSLSQVQLIGERNAVDKLVKEKQLSCIIEFTAKSRRSLYRCGQQS
ncbi:ArnT family glycosyltransferase [Vibrio europaeus]|uniref:ArnT family glycosyltransferase n=1 Tax=Vibrio europaeus TaxID=300876 RepID=UPI00233F4D7F|nr:glycosyltransferase family 39 protein [Vibrio europaeus]MDC5822547.1 glycosyltransferase family 39 protein [Vibrio europaeus]MDC5838190.1 glycosyltransferase family 39 protein [Vibrio europaeus]MDC5854198.1 glycosyltransferase family 39 protein [Vibrio europaeus]MDC5869180.1 glycosyltransferase family 39 protein [Vibrio europaeus]